MIWDASTPQGQAATAAGCGTPTEENAEECKELCKVDGELVKAPASGDDLAAGVEWINCSGEGVGAPPPRHRPPRPPPPRSGRLLQLYGV
jgi:hypothetical protein